MSGLGYVVVMGAALLALPGLAAAGSPKPSQLVTASSSFATTCPAGVAVDQLEKADGTVAAFSIPVRQIFVLTQAEVSVPGSAGIAGNPIEVKLLREGAASTSTISVLQGTIGSSGGFGAVVDYPLGVSVKRGLQLCVDGQDVTAGAPMSVTTVVHGFFAPDK